MRFIATILAFLMMITTSARANEPDLAAAQGFVTQLADDAITILSANKDRAGREAAFAELLDERANMRLEDGRLRHHRPHDLVSQRLHLLTPAAQLADIRTSAGANQQHNFCKNRRLKFELDHSAHSPFALDLHMTKYVSRDR